MSASAFQVAWERADLPDMPTELLVMPVGVEEDERRAVVNAALHELRGIGVEAVELALRVLGRPSRSVDVRLPMLRGLVAAHGDRAVLAVLNGDRVNVREIDPGGVSRAAIGLLPAAPAGPGSSVCVPSDVMSEAAAGAGTSENSLGSELTRLGVRSADARQLASMVVGRHSSGQFGVTVVERNGKRHRGGHVVSYFDTPRGRYLIKEQRGWITMAPADFRLLVAQLDRLLHETDPAR